MTTQDGQKESSALDPLEASLEAIYRARGWVLVVLVTLLSQWNIMKVFLVYAPVFAGLYVQVPTIGFIKSLFTGSIPVEWECVSLNCEMLVQEAKVRKKLLKLKQLSFTKVKRLY